MAQCGSNLAVVLVVGVMVLGLVCAQSTNMTMTAAPTYDPTLDEYYDDSSWFNDDPSPEPTIYYPMDDDLDPSQIPEDIIDNAILVSRLVTPRSLRNVCVNKSSETVCMAATDQIIGLGICKFNPTTRLCSLQDVPTFCPSNLKAQLLQIATCGKKCDVCTPAYQTLWTMVAGMAGLRVPFDPAHPTQPFTPSFVVAGRYPPVGFANDTSPLMWRQNNLTAAQVLTIQNAEMSLVLCTTQLNMTMLNGFARGGLRLKKCTAAAAAVKELIATAGITLAIVFGLYALARLGSWYKSFSCFSRAAHPMLTTPPYDLLISHVDDELERRRKRAAAYKEEGIRTYKFSDLKYDEELLKKKVAGRLYSVVPGLTWAKMGFINDLMVLAKIATDSVACFAIIRNSFQASSVILPYASGFQLGTVLMYWTIVGTKTNDVAELVESDDVSGCYCDDGAKAFLNQSSYKHFTLFAEMDSHLTFMQKHWTIPVANMVNNKMVLLSAQIAYGALIWAFINLDNYDFTIWGTIIIAAKIVAGGVTFIMTAVKFVAAVLSAYVRSRGGDKPGAYLRFLACKSIDASLKTILVDSRLKSMSGDTKGIDAGTTVVNIQPPGAKA